MLERISATVDSSLLEAFDRFIASHGYENRSEAIRDLIRQTLLSDDWQRDDREVMGVITLVYDHHRPNLLNRLTQIQHDARVPVITTTHIHMDHHNCLEIIVVRGAPPAIRELADRMISLRGVKNGSLSAASAGAGSAAR